MPRARLSVRVPNFRAKAISRARFTIVTAGTAAISGASRIAHRRSRINSRPMCQTSQVNFQKSPDSPKTTVRPRLSPSRNSRRLRAPGTSVEDVIHAERQAMLVEIGKQRRHVVAPALQFDVMAFLDIVDAHVQTGSGGSPAGDLFAEEEIRVAAQGLDGVDRIVVGDRHQVHPAPLELVVDVERMVVALAADSVEQGHCAHPGPDGMDVEITPHASL